MSDWVRYGRRNIITIIQYLLKWKPLHLLPPCCPSDVPPCPYSPAALCLAHLGRMAEAAEALQAMAALPAADYPDLFLELGMSLLAMGQHAHAKRFLSAMLVRVGLSLYIIMSHSWDQKAHLCT